MIKPSLTLYSLFFWQETWKNSAFSYTLYMHSDCFLRGGVGLYFKFHYPMGALNRGNTVLVYQLIMFEGTGDILK